MKLQHNTQSRNIEDELEHIIILRKRQKGYLASSYQQQIRFPKILQSLSVHQQESRVNIHQKKDNSIRFNSPLMRSTDFENEKIKGIKALKDYYSEVSKLIIMQQMKRLYRVHPTEQISQIRSPYLQKSFDSQLNATPKKLKRVRGYLKMINGFQDGLDQSNLLQSLETNRSQQPRRLRLGTMNIDFSSHNLCQDNSFVQIK